jgi:hypothetical protein
MNNKNRIVTKKIYAIKLCEYEFERELQEYYGGKTLNFGINIATK